MPRARLLKIGFFTNEDLARLSHTHRLLFAGLWLLADKEGRLEDRPLRIKGQLFPYEVIDVEPLLQDLAREGFILRYHVPCTPSSTTAPFIAIPKFRMHQTPHHREAESVIPPPCNTPARQPEARPGKASAGPSVPVLVLDPVSDPESVPDPVAVPSAKDQSSPAPKTRVTARPPETADENLKIITRIAHQTFDELGLANPDVTEAVKERCAKLKIAYSGSVVRKAVDSAAWQRTHR